jgi:S-adenosylmethionine:tRNA ribosyltransferase-isomerase
MTIDLMDFPEPPAELIAQRPLPERDAARMMVLDRAAEAWSHKTFRDLPSYFRPGDVLVLNDVRVFPARVTGVKPTGGRVKMLLLERNGAGDRWTTLLTPAQKTGQSVRLAPDLEATVQGQRDGGEYEVLFSRPVGEDELSRLGRMPLPPYIRRGPDDDPSVESLDRDYYQTVFSAPAPPPPSGAAFEAPGAVAAPTAGLHFTPELLARIEAAGVEVRRLRLNVGWGTFRPVQGDYRSHKMMSESYFIPDATADAVNRAKAEGRRVWAVGTTVVRTLEGSAGGDGKVRPGAGATALYIHPGFTFRVVDVLVTNFHLRHHTPLLLTAALAGPAFLRRAYDEAVREKYRFLSYGDGMVVLNS